MILDLYINATQKDWIDIFGILGQVIVPALVFVFSMIYTNKRNKKQDEQFNKQLDLTKEQWLTEAYIKNESEVLLNAQKKLLPVIDEVEWFHSAALSQLSLYTNSYIDPLPSSLNLEFKKKLQIAFNHIKELNNFIAENHSIFIKHNLEKNFSYLNLYLNLINFIPKNEQLEIIKLESSCFDLNQNKEIPCTCYRYTFWYKLIYGANEWLSGGIRTFGSHCTFVPLFDDKVLDNAEKVFYESRKCFEDALNYLNNKTVFGNNNAIDNEIMQKWPLDFEGNL